MATNSTKRRKYKTALHSLLATGPSPSRSAWQDAILTHLTQNCSVTNSSFLSMKETKKKLFFPSPLPINVVPKPSLAKELKTVEHGDTPLHLAIRMACTSEVVAALCHLNPKAASITHSSGSLPLHFAVSRPTGGSKERKSSAREADTIKIIGFLIETYPNALVIYDSDGKTPLHRLLETHVDGRSVQTVQLLSQNVDASIWKKHVPYTVQTVSSTKFTLPIPSVLKKSSQTQNHNSMNVFTPPSALAIPDAIYGCIPLHYAVMNGAVKDVVKCMVKIYPASVAMGDCMQRTALHWTFGAGANCNVSGNDAGSTKRQPLHQTYRSSGIIAILLHKDPAFPFEPAKLRDINTEGTSHRTPLHYAVELIGKHLIDPPSLKIDKGTPTPCLSLKALKFLIKCNKHAVVKQDARGQTPIHVLFRVAHEWNDLQYQKLLLMALTGSREIAEPPQDLKIFSPPKELIEMLLQNSVISLQKSREDHYQIGSTSVDYRQDMDVDNEYVEDAGIADDNATTIQDKRGLLPLHCAVLAVTAPEILSMMLEINPTSLIKPTYCHDLNERDAANISKQYDIIPQNPVSYVSSFSGSGRTPMHMAFANPYVARWHSEVTLEPLLFFNLQSDKNKTNTSPENSNNSEPQMLIDGTIVLKCEDSNGDTPLHLAAKHNASLSMLRILLKCHPEAAITKSKRGNLPVHVVLDENYLFASIKLSLVGKNRNDRKEIGNDDANPFSNEDEEFRNIVKQMAKTQSIALRLEEFKLCGAIFAPSSGWTSDDNEAECSRSRNDILQRVNLLLKPLIHHCPSLTSPCAAYGLLPLHIAIAFHALPYKDLHAMLREAPQTVRHITTADAFTALDLHTLRSTVPGEITNLEMEAWRAIQQLLFSYEAFPLNDQLTFQSDSFAQIRKDKEKISSFVEQIIREFSEKGIRSYHEIGKHPVDPEHMTLGFLNDTSVEKDRYELSNCKLGDAGTRLWKFLTIFQNRKDSSDHYAQYVMEILSKLSSEEIEHLSNLRVVENELEKQNVSQSELTVQGCANPYCKAEIHSKSFFAGSYDFQTTLGTSIFLHEGYGGKTLSVSAIENIFDLRETGDSENQIIESSIEKRPVCVKFMKSRKQFESEIGMRAELKLGKKYAHEGPIVSMLDYYDATKLNVKKNKKFAFDRKNKRFQHVPIYSLGMETPRQKRGVQQKFVDISRFPYAIVYPLGSQKNLLESVACGAMNQELGMNIFIEMAEVLKTLHNKGFVHGNFGVSSLLPFSTGQWKDALTKWQLTKVDSLIRMKQSSVSHGMINSDGYYAFESSVLPPEMFTKVNAAQLLMYEEYWKAVFELEETDVSPDIIKPRIDPISGDAYVMKCYCSLSEKVKKSMPPLPYDLVKPSKSTDIWSFGLFLFFIISGGETLIQTNIRTGSITCMELIAEWNSTIAERLIHQSIHDVVAQDLLLHILAPLEQRNTMDMGTILSHPFFKKRADVSGELIKYMTERNSEREAWNYVRSKKMKNKKDAQLLKSSMVTLPRLSLPNQLKLVASPSELLKGAFDSTGAMSQLVPFCYILLPYELKIGSDGKRSPVHADDVEILECIGSLLLGLCKACQFVNCVKLAMELPDDEKEIILHRWIQDIKQDPASSSQCILSTLELDSEYNDLAGKLVSFAREDIDKFISHPMYATKRIIEEHVAGIVTAFEVKGTAFLYLVDEYNGLPVMEVNGTGIYPHCFKNNIADIVYKSLPFVYACISHVNGAEHGVRAFVKLVFEAAYPLIPPPWVIACRGMKLSLDKEKIISEIKILHEVTQKMIEDENSISADSAADELHFLQDFFQHIDSEQTFCDLRPVTDGKSILWTTEDVSRLLQKESEWEANPKNLHKLVNAIKKKT